MSALLAILLSQAVLRDQLPSEPDAAVQKETLRKVRDLFKDEYAKRRPADQVALARKLLQSGAETSGDDAAKFVLLKEAREIAVAAGDPETALRAVDETAKSFSVDGPALKLAVLGKVVVKEPEAARTVARGYLALVNDAIRIENFEAAGIAAQRAEALARGAQDPALAARAAEVKAEVASLKAEAGRVKGGDSEAIGRYLCFVKGDWDAGVPHLIAGAKPPLKTAAEKEALKPQDAAMQADLADLWWDLAQKEKSSWRRERILARAKQWLDLAAPSASGLVKVRVQKRLDDLEALQPGFVNLLKLIDPAKDGIEGSWKLDNGRLVSPPGKFVRLEIPYQPPPEYDFRVVFSRVDGANNVSQILSRQNKAFVWIMELGQSRCALGNCRGLWITEAGNPSITKVTETQNDNGPHTSVLEVRKDRVRCFFNGKLILEYKTDYADLSMNAGWKLKSEQLLGLGCWESPTEFHRVDVIEVSGKGKRTR